MVGVLPQERRQPPADPRRAEQRADFRAGATVHAPTSPVRTLASFEILDGVPGALPA